jgi:hypothetical protein
MQKWEYCTLTAANTDKGEYKLLFYSATIKQGFLIKQEAWGQAIAQLGLDGWEVVSVNGNNLFFKRPLPER